MSGLLGKEDLNLGVLVFGDDSVLESFVAFRLNFVFSTRSLLAEWSDVKVSLQG